MARYFFDFRSGTTISRDDEGQDLLNACDALQAATGALGDAIRDVVMEGATEQRFVVEVRDELGPVLEVSAVLGSRIIRKQ